MSILPSFAVRAAGQAAAVSRVVDIPREYGIDFHTGQLTGKIVEGIEAIKVWVWCCMKTERFRYAIYSWDYGGSMEQYIGKGLSKEYIETDCEAEVREALLVNPYITGIADFHIDFGKDKLKLNFTVNTKLGDVGVSDFV